MYAKESFCLLCFFLNDETKAITKHSIKIGTMFVSEKEKVKKKLFPFIWKCNTVRFHRNDIQRKCGKKRRNLASHLG